MNVESRALYFLIVGNLLTVARSKSRFISTMEERLCLLNSVMNTVITCRLQANDQEKHADTSYV
jgi:hypothetical protein